MAQVPNVGNATLDDRKITKYLLDDTHPQNQGKAKFFNLFGFTQANWQELRKALLDHPRNNAVVSRAHFNMAKCMRSVAHSCRPTAEILVFDLSGLSSRPTQNQSSSLHTPLRRKLAEDDRTSDGSRRFMRVARMSKQRDALIAARQWINKTCYAQPHLPLEEVRA